MQALLSPDSFLEEKKGGGLAEKGEGRWARPCGVISAPPPLILFEGHSWAVHCTKTLGTSASAAQATATHLAFFAETKKSFGRSSLGEIWALTNIQEAGITFLLVVSGLIRRHQPRRSELVNPACVEAWPATFTPLKGQRRGLQTTW